MGEDRPAVKAPIDIHPNTREYYKGRGGVVIGGRYETNVNLNLVYRGLALSNLSAYPQNQPFLKKFYNQHNMHVLPKYYAVDYDYRNQLIQHMTRAFKFKKGIWALPEKQFLTYFPSLTSKPTSVHPFYGIQSYLKNPPKNPLKQDLFAEYYASSSPNFSQSLPTAEGTNP